MKKRKRSRRPKFDTMIDELNKIDQSVEPLLLPPGQGCDLKPAPGEHPMFKKLMEEERAFLNPEEWGLDLRPIFQEQLDSPASPDDLSDHEVRGLLRWMVLILAQHHCCLVSTNHLSDRDLYRHIMEVVLPKPLGVSSHPEGGLLYHECCPCDAEEWYQFYADDDEREDYARIMGEPLLPKLPLVSDRDTWLETLAEAHRHEPLPDYEKG